MDNVLQATSFIHNPNGYSIVTNAESCNIFEHAHNFYELAYVTDSQGIHHAGGQDQFVQRGHFVLLSPYMPHYFLASDSEAIPRLRVYNCLFTTDFFQESIQNFMTESSLKNTRLFQLFSNNKPFYLLLEDDHSRTILNAIKAMEKEYINQSIGSTYIIQNHLQNIMIQTCRLMSDPAPSIQYPDMDYRMDELVRYINSHYDLPLTLDFLADYVHLSPEYLSRYFKKNTGNTLKKYLTELRIQKAKELLLYTTHTISEVCYMCGFSSESNFRKYFHQSCGISPSDYKKVNTVNYSILR